MGDPRKREAEDRQVWQPNQFPKMGIGDPTGAQIDADDPAGCVLDSRAAQVLDPLRVHGAFDLRRRRWNAEPQEQGYRRVRFHLICSFDSEDPSRGRIRWRTWEARLSAPPSPF